VNLHSVFKIIRAWVSHKPTRGEVPRGTQERCVGGYSGYSGFKKYK
jgi:hypothetical protein